MATWRNTPFHAGRELSGIGRWMAFGGAFGGTPRAPLPCRGASPHAGQWLQSRSQAHGGIHRYHSLTVRRHEPWPGPAL